MSEHIEIDMAFGVRCEVEKPKYEIRFVCDADKAEAFEKYLSTLGYEVETVKQP